jgi:tetratricopeptide (TPR) repeat protein
VEAEIVLTRFLKERAERVPGKRADGASGKNVLQVALVERAHVRARKNKVDLALKDFTSAITARPSTHLYLARGRLQESLGQFDQAAAGYREGLARVGSAHQLKKALIRVEIKRQQYSQALGLIDQELPRASVKTSWHLRRAEILDLMGQEQASHMAKEKALTEASRVLRKRNTALNSLARAEVHMALGHRPEARRDLELAVKMAPNLDKARELLKTLKGQEQ